MLSTIQILNFILPILYASTIVVYYLDFKQNKKTLNNSKRLFLFITLFVHIIYFILRMDHLNHPPITNKFEIFTVLAFAVSFSYFILELITDIRGTGLFVISISLIFQFFSSAFIDYELIVPEVLRNRLLGLHVMSAILGYSGFAIASVYGVLYLMLYKEIKLKKFGLIFNRLPSLETLEQLNHYSVVIGFILLTFAISIGGIWLPDAFPDFSYSDPKLITTFFVWVLFGVGILIKFIAKWYGKKFILYSLFGFLIVIISLVITNVFKSTFHSFYN